MLLIGPRLPLTFQVTISVKKQAEIPAWGKIGGESKTEWTLSPRPLACDGNLK